MLLGEVLFYTRDFILYVYVTRSDKIGLIAENTHVHIMVYIISSVGAIEILFVS